MNKPYPQTVWNRSPFDVIEENESHWSSSRSSVAQGTPSLPSERRTQYRKIEQENKIPKRGIRNPSLYVPRILKELTEQEATQRRGDFINDPAMIEGIEKLERLVGKRNAHDYFQRVLYNLRYIEP